MTRLLTILIAQADGPVMTETGVIISIFAGALLVLNWVNQSRQIKQQEAQNENTKTRDREFMAIIQSLNITLEKGAELNRDSIATNNLLIEESRKTRDKIEIANGHYNDSKELLFGVKTSAELAAKEAKRAGDLIQVLINGDKS